MTSVPKFDAVFNFRDVGGYLTSKGETVKRGCIFRSGHLSLATDMDLEKIAGLNIKCVFDLRGKEEQQTSPNRLPSDIPIATKSLPIWPVAENEIERSILEGRIREYGKSCSKQIPDTADAMKSFYRSFIRDNNDAWSELFHIIPEVEDPVLIHCAGGKDRTGIASAILLRVLGVPDETIMRNYLDTNAAVDKWIAEDHREGLPAFFLSVMKADARYLQSAFEFIEEEYGSFEQFLIIGLKFTTEHRGKLKDRLLS